MILQNPVLTTFVEMIFWLCVFMIFYTYVLFPEILKLLAGRKRAVFQSFASSDDLPLVSVIISAYNEMEVIGQKVSSVFVGNYPSDRLEVLVGSDASTDQTNLILEKLDREFPGLKFYPFKERRGKGNVINDLYNLSRGEIIVFTDANVMFHPDTLIELVRYFKDSRIGLVDTHMINTHINADGISVQEKSYIAREVMIKQREGIVWGTMMGPFGGCFAVRREVYEPVPRNFLVDDFYINMKVLEKGYWCINNLDALVYEDISNDLREEFWRKVRISTGNFQNLKAFSHFIISGRKGLSFNFLSHKVIRWLGPFFLLTAYAINALLALAFPFYFYIFILHSLLFVVPLLDFLLRQVGVNVAILRFITHFYSMNLALLTGFIKTFKKIESNVWKPTKRNQA